VVLASTCISVCSGAQTTPRVQGGSRQSAFIEAPRISTSLSQTIHDPLAPVSFSLGRLCDNFTTYKELCTHEVQAAGRSTTLNNTTGLRRGVVRVVALAFTT